MKKIIFAILVIFIMGCAAKTAPPTTTNYTPEVTAQVTTTVTIESTTTTTEEKEQLPPMTRGEADPDFVLEVYNIDKAMDGTTLFADNHNQEKPRIIEVNMLGEIIWEYDLPQELKQYTNPGFDVELLPNNNILFELPRNGVYEINRNKTIVWSYKTSKISHDADRLPNGNTLIAFGSGDRMSDAQVKEIDPKGNIVWQWYAKTYFDTEAYRSINEEGWSHTNAVLRMDNGDTLVSPRNFNMLVEVNPKGEVVKTIGQGLMVQQHDPVFLANGNLLFANHVTPNRIVEIDPNETVVWEYVIEDLRLSPARDADRLTNGNTLITGTTKIFEVTPDKEIVWAFAIKDISAFTKDTSPMLGFYKAERILK